MPVIYRVRVDYNIPGKAVALHRTPHPLLAHDVGFLTLDPKLDPPGLDPLLCGDLIPCTPFKNRASAHANVPLSGLILMFIKPSVAIVTKETFIC